MTNSAQITSTSTSSVDVTTTLTTSITTTFAVTSTSITYIPTATATIYSGALKFGGDNLRLDTKLKTLYITTVGPSPFVLDPNTNYICGPGRAACLTSNPTLTNPIAEIIFQAPTTTPNTTGYFPLLCQLGDQGSLSCTVNNQPVFIMRCGDGTATYLYISSGSPQCPSGSSFIQTRPFTFTPS